MSATGYGPPPEPTLEESLTAKVIATGTFVRSADGRYVFVPAEVLQGQLAEATELTAGRQRAFCQREDGSATVQVATLKPYQCCVEADRPGLWFFDPEKGKGQDLAWQPVELTEGYQALLAGHTPGVVFRALQQLDVDMQWEAMEELAAKPDDGAIAALHRIVLTGRQKVSRSACRALSRTQLLRPDELWGIWPQSALPTEVAWCLRSADHQRFLAELSKADKVNQTWDTAYLLQNEPAEFQRELSLRWLRCSAASTRLHGAGLARQLLSRLAHPRPDSAEARAAYEGQHAILSPVLRERLTTELDEDVRKAVGQALDVAYTPPNVHPPAPAPPYSEQEEFEELVKHIGGWGPPAEAYSAASASAGRELATHFRKQTLAWVTKDMAGPEGSRQDRACTVACYLDLPECQDIIAQRIDTMYLKRRGFFPTSTWLTILARSSDPTYHEIMFDTIRRHVLSGGKHAELSGSPTGALGQCDNPEALVMLRQQVLPRTDSGRRWCLLSMAGRGDREAAKELLARLGSEGCRVQSDEEDRTVASSLGTLGMAQTAEVTAILKLHAAQMWPPRSLQERRRGADPALRRVPLQNWVGPRQRDTILAEVARRDPQWLAAFALEKMRTGKLTERCYARSILAQLTARDFGHDPTFLAKQRAEAMARIDAWWQRNQSRSREEWLLDVFRERGYQMDRLWCRESLPVLCQAMDGSAIEILAVEQISVITDKLFLPCGSASYPLRDGQTQARVRGWLKARGYLPAEEAEEP